MGLFIETDSQKIRNNVITSVEAAVGDQLSMGDERRIFAEAVALLFVSMYNTVDVAAKNKMLEYATGSALDALGARVGVNRLPPKEAFCTLRFFVNAPRSMPVTIPAGTKVTKDARLFFATDRAVTLAAGKNSVDVEASATEGGAQYNGFAVDTITQIVDTVQYIDGVRNITATEGGDDGEPDTDAGNAHLRERIKTAGSYSTAGTAAAYRYYTLSADPKVIDAYVDSPSDGVIKIYPLLQGGEIPGTDMLETIVKAVTAADVKPMTDHVLVEAPTAVRYNVTLKYYYLKENAEDVIDTIEGTGGAVQRYLEWQSGAVGRAIDPDELRLLCLSPSWDSDKKLSKAYRVEIISPAYTVIAKNAVAKLGTLTVTHEVI